MIAMKTFPRFVFAALLLLMTTLAGAQTTFPDFTDLAQKASAAVVYIEATRTAAAHPADAGDDIDPQDMPEFFRRFFGQPGMPPMEPRDQVSSGSGFLISSDGDRKSPRLNSSHYCASRM